MKKFFSYDAEYLLDDKTEKAINDFYGTEIDFNAMISEHEERALSNGYYSTQHDFRGEVVSYKGLNKTVDTVYYVLERAGVDEYDEGEFVQNIERAVFRIKF